MIGKSDGYIKFSSQWECVPCQIPSDWLLEINQCRSKLKSAGMVGIDNDGIGFGNISIRNANTNQFFITGSATGGHNILTENHIALVTKFDIDGNHLACVGKTNASSESLSHAAIYHISPSTMVVIHIHHHQLWNQYYAILPTTKSTAMYGTPEIANSITALYATEAKTASMILIMGGHQDGIIAFGKTLTETTESLFNLLK